MVAFEVAPSLSRVGARKDGERLASEIAAARVKDPTKRKQLEEPLYGEVDYELRLLDGDARAGGVVYDGRMLAEVLMRMIGEAGLGVAHVVLTDRLVSTFSQEDLRHHLRTVVLGFPSIVSIPGIVEAPAKPRSYYVKKQAMEMMGASQLEMERLKEQFRGSFVDYGDPAMIEVLKGLLLQAVMFHLTLRPFCGNRTCRLFNAHWQEELLASQVAPDGVCSTHRSQLRMLSKKPFLRW